MSSVGDARGPVDVHAGIVIAPEAPDAGVQAHAHTDRGVPGPVCLGQAALGRGRGRDRLSRIGEDREEGVALRRDHDPARLHDGRPEQAMMEVDDLDEGLAERL